MPGEKTALISRLNRIGVALASETNIDRLFRLIVSSAMEFTHADGGSLYIKEGDNLLFVVVDNRTLSKREGWKQAFEPHPVPLSEKSIAGYVALSGRAVNVPDAYRIPPAAPYSFDRKYDEMHNYRTASLVAVPMKDSGGKIVGVIQLINRKSPSGAVMRFTEDDEELLMSLASQAAVAYHNAKLMKQLRDLLDSLIEYSAAATDARSPFTAGHTRRLVKYCMALAKALNREKTGRLATVKLSLEQLEALRFAAWLHDIGKLSTPEQVLGKSSKLPLSTIEAIKYRFKLAEVELEREKELRLNHCEPELRKAISQEYDRKIQELRDDFKLIVEFNTEMFTSEESAARLKRIALKTFDSGEGRNPLLTDEEVENLSVRRGNLSGREWQVIKDHVMKSEDFLRHIRFPEWLKDVPEIAGAHHERLDGSGYPRGLKGDEIPLGARIIAIADVYEALVAPDRPYKKQLSKEEAVKVLQGLADKNQLDPDLVELFIRRKIYEIPVD